MPSLVSLVLRVRSVSSWKPWAARNAVSFGCMPLAVACTAFWPVMAVAILRTLLPMLVRLSSFSGKVKS
jgi:hypothetical protein